MRRHRCRLSFLIKKNKTKQLCINIKLLCSNLMAQLFSMSSENIPLSLSRIATITSADMLICSHLRINLLDDFHRTEQGFPRPWFSTASFQHLGVLPISALGEAEVGDATSHQLRWGLCVLHGAGVRQLMKCFLLLSRIYFSALHHLVKHFKEENSLAMSHFAVVFEHYFNDLCVI